MASPQYEHEKELNRGLHSGIIIVLFCVIGTAFATWVTFEARNFSEQTTLSAQVDTSESDKLRMPDDALKYTYQPPTDAYVKRSGQLERRSTPLKTVRDLGAKGREAYTTLNALYDSEFVNPRRLRAGMPITAYFEQDTERLMAVSFRLSSEQTVITKRLADDSFFTSSLSASLSVSHKRVTEQISSSFYEAAIQAGMRDKQIADFAQIFAFDVDFQREIRSGDTFEVVYEIYADERGNEVRSGDVIFASFDGKSVSRDYYRHTPADDGISDYFTHEGKASTRFLMKTPINGARLSSNFGRRRHPISGYSRLHKGTDFAARSGTPIFAAGNGVIERASRYGGYGKYARIQHANGYETAYAHMSRYGPGVRKGARIRQGDIIGYVGSTGASTGPHLHYEVLINGKHVNAMRLKLPTGRTLEGDFLNAFNKARNDIDNLRRSLGADIETAALTPENALKLQ